ncbi:MAG: ankyrin repeat domain-containing protein [Actinomycetota bacterium]|nr:ankyrin repeat domain-containing protein [Actinomycetota bacterium]
MPEELDEKTLAFAHRVFDLARSGERDALAELVAAGAPANLTNDKGDSLLILAAYHDHPHTVRMLLDHGADTTRVNDRGQTALAAAVFRQSAEGVGALLDGGADPALGSPSAFEVARFFELPEMLAQLEDGAAPTP